MKQEDSESERECRERPMEEEAEREGELEKLNRSVGRDKQGAGNI